MKLISLNLWGGRIKEPLFEFLASNQDVDIFCFQEIYNKAQHKMANDNLEPVLNLYSELQILLPNHKSFFRPVIRNEYGIGTFVKSDIEVLEEDEIKIFENLNYPGMGGNHSRNLQWLHCVDGDTKFSIINVHGLWNGLGKFDSPDRLEQSKRIKDFISRTFTPKILCGDFNLRPDTESLCMLETGMDNLIKKNNITSTRSNLYTKEEKFADYVFVSSEIKVNNFEVLPDEVSDHLALKLEFAF